MTEPRAKLRPVVTYTLEHRVAPERKAIAPAMVPVSFTPAQLDKAMAAARSRSENATLRDCAGADAKRAAQNEEIHKRNIEQLRKENLKLQEQLLASQERVYELQGKLLSLREIVNSA